MLESSLVSESSGMGAGKVIDKKAHFKEGAIDFTAGSLGISMNSNLNLKVAAFLMQIAYFLCYRWCGIGLCEPAAGYGKSENASISNAVQRHGRLFNTNV